MPDKFLANVYSAVVLLFDVNLAGNGFWVYDHIPSELLVFGIAGGILKLSCPSCVDHLLFLLQPLGLHIWDLLLRALPV